LGLKEFYGFVSFGQWRNFMTGVRLRQEDDLKIFAHKSMMLRVATLTKREEKLTVEDLIGNLGKSKEQIERERKELKFEAMDVQDEMDAIGDVRHLLGTQSEKDH
jgi:hypothetical protein